MLLQRKPRLSPFWCPFCPSCWFAAWKSTPTIPVAPACPWLPELTWSCSCSSCSFRRGGCKQSLSGLTFLISGLSRRKMALYGWSGAWRCTPLLLPAPWAPADALSSLPWVFASRRAVSTASPLRFWGCLPRRVLGFCCSSLWSRSCPRGKCLRTAIAMESGSCAWRLQESPSSSLSFRPKLKYGCEQWDSWANLETRRVGSSQTLPDFSLLKLSTSGWSVAWKCILSKTRSTAFVFRSLASLLHRSWCSRLSTGLEWTPKRKLLVAPLLPLSNLCSSEANTQRLCFLRCAALNAQIELSFEIQQVPLPA